MHNHDFSRLKLCSEAFGFPERNIIDFPISTKRKEINQLSTLKGNNDYAGFNQFTMSIFRNFKNNKPSLVKTDQLLIRDNQKDNFGYMTKSYMTTYIRNNYSPSKSNKTGIPNKDKHFSMPNSSREINTKTK